VGIVTEALVNGQAMTVREVAELAGLTIQGAYAMLCSLSYRLPIYDDPATGKWHYLK
jgi:DNA-binding IclR family transcriptional regulator